MQHETAVVKQGTVPNLTVSGLERLPRFTEVIREVGPSALSLSRKMYGAPGAQSSGFFVSLFTKDPPAQVFWQLHGSLGTVEHHRMQNRATENARIHALSGAQDAKEPPRGVVACGGHVISVYGPLHEEVLDGIAYQLAKLTFEEDLKRSVASGEVRELESSFYNELAAATSDDD